MRTIWVNFHLAWRFDWWDMIIFSWLRSWGICSTIRIRVCHMNFDTFHGLSWYLDATLLWLFVIYGQYLHWRLMVSEWLSELSWYVMKSQILSNYNCVGFGLSDCENMGIIHWNSTCIYMLMVLFWKYGDFSVADRIRHMHSCLLVFFLKCFRNAVIRYLIWFLLTGDSMWNIDLGWSISTNKECIWWPKEWCNRHPMRW